MAEKFYEIGRAGRERRIDYSKVFDSTIKAVETRLADSKLKTEELISKMPQGVPIDKVPEELRGQVTAFLTQGKQKYVDASKIIASGIPASSQKYLDAVETMNTVNNSFSKLSNSLESIAVQRQKDLDNTSVSEGAEDWQGIDQNNLANGSMYASMVLQADGNWTYGSAELDDSGNAKRKLWDNYSSAPKPGTEGITSFVAMRDTVRQQKRNGQTWDSIREDYSQMWDGLMTKLETNGVRDMIFQDKEYINSKITVDQADDPVEYKKQLNQFKKDPTQLIADYKDYAMSPETGLKYTYDNAKGPDPIRSGGGGRDAYQSRVDAAGGYVSFEDQDTIINKALAGETMYDWKGGKWTTDDGGITYSSENYGLPAEPVLDVLGGPYFTLGSRAGRISFANNAKNKEKKQNLVNKFSGDLGFKFVSMNANSAEAYLTKILPSDYTFDGSAIIGLGDGIKIYAPSYKKGVNEEEGVDYIDVNLQPFSYKGDVKNKDKVVKFLEATYNPNNYDEDGQPIII